MRKNMTHAALAVAGALLVAVPAGAQERDPETPPVRLAVLGDAGAGGAAVVRGGIPLPEAAGVRDTDHLGIFRDAVDARRPERVDVQWRVLSRWGGRPEDASRPIRWVLADFASTPGSSYVLRTDARPPRELDSLASSDDTAVHVDTGRLSFSVPKDRFAPLADLSVRGYEAAPLARGLDVVLVNVENGDRADPESDLVDRTYRLSTTKADSVAIEENGPVRAVVAVRGRFADDSGEPLLGGFIGYTLRIVADLGADQVKLFFTLENNGQYGPPSEPSIHRSKPKWLHIRRLDLEVPTALAGSIFGSTADTTWELGKHGAADEMRLLQIHRVKAADNESQNFVYTVKTGSLLVGTGDRSESGFLVDDGKRSVLAGIRHFWQNNPKAISFAGGTLRYELWPQEPGQRWPRDHGDLDVRFGDAYQFEGGRHKTYEMLLAFPHAGQDRGTVVRTRERALQYPPTLRIDPQSVVSDGAVGALGPVDVAVKNSDLQASMRHFARMQLGQVDVTYCDPQGAGDEVPPASLITQRETRGNALPSSLYNLDLYGYMNFGDLPHFDGYCSGHYDWIRGLFENYLRHGKRDFLDVGVEMMRHRYDIDQFHGSERSDPNWSWYNGLQRADAGRHGAWTSKFHPHGEWTPSPQQTWLEGLLLGYALTGDTRALEAARENAEAFVNYYTHGTNRIDPAIREPLTYYGQLSAYAIAVEQLLAFYEFTGEERYLGAASLIFEEGILHAEEYFGNQGFFAIPGERQNLFPAVRLLRPLIRMHEVGGDDRALALLLRMLRWIRRDGYSDSGKMVMGRYLPLQLPYMWSDPSGDRVADRWFVAYNFFTTDAFAYAFEQTGREEYMEFARELFRDSALFFQCPVHQPVDRAFYSRVSYTPSQYPGSETKPGAWLLTAHGRYLRAEQALAAGADPVTMRNDGFFSGYAGRATLRDSSNSQSAPDQEPVTPVDSPMVPKAEFGHEPGPMPVQQPLPPGFDISILRLVPASGGVRVEFVTTEPATARIEVRDVDGNGAWQSTSVAAHSPRLRHDLVLGAMQIDRLYELRVQATDIGGDTALSEVKRFRLRTRRRATTGRTPPPVRAPAGVDAMPIAPRGPDTRPDPGPVRLPAPPAAPVRPPVTSPSAPPTRPQPPRPPEPPVPTAAPSRPVVPTPTVRRPVAPAPKGSGTVSVESSAGAAREIILDETQAVFSGAWSASAGAGALGGNQRIASDASAESTAVWAVTPPNPGTYRCYLRWGSAADASTRTRVRIKNGGAPTTVTLNQRETSGRWRLLGAVKVVPGERVTITVSNAGADGVVAVDSLRLVPMSEPGTSR